MSVHRHELSDSHTAGSGDQAREPCQKHGFDVLSDGTDTHHERCHGDQSVVGSQYRCPKDLCPLRVVDVVFFNGLAWFCWVYYYFIIGMNYGNLNMEMPLNHAHIEIPMIHPNEVNPKPSQVVITEENYNINYSQRAQLLRAAVLGANDGLVTVASLMMGVSAVRQDIKSVLLAGFAGLIAGACSMGIGEFLSVYTQLDIELVQMKRQKEENKITIIVDNEEKKEDLPNPFQASMASMVAFSIGGVVPLMGAIFIKDYKVRMCVVVALASLALVVFGVIGAILGKTSVSKSCVRVVIGGWMAMAITFAFTKLIGFAGI
ncbi:vacuolar iron transporter-like protein 4-like [Senna tora]|uniref:Vacuolar iron transporter-like protein 4-like n=1 Tax=Senna tora TaxID=362788 RepID=A0A834XC18_9FABA|nr:vacuolar iron transporter-like protein 4-like [Senna tora]